VRCRQFGQDHLPGFRIEPAEIVRLFIGKPQNAIVIEDGSVRVDFRAIGRAVLRDRTSSRIEFSNIPSGDRGEPDVTVFVGDQTVRT
jgi:hypothetical protein